MSVSKTGSESSQSRWKNYGSMLLKPAELYWKGAKTRLTIPFGDESNGGRIFFMYVFLAYFEDDKEIKKDFLSGKEKSFIKALFESISPLKLLNPFKIVTSLMYFFQSGIGGLVDVTADFINTKMDNEPNMTQRESGLVARIAKAILTFPFTVVGMIVSPLSTLEYLPLDMGPYTYKDDIDASKEIEEDYEKKQEQHPEETAKSSNAVMLQQMQKPQPPKKETKIITFADEGDDGPAYPIPSYSGFQTPTVTSEALKMKSESPNIEPKTAKFEKTTHQTTKKTEMKIIKLDDENIDKYEPYPGPHRNGGW